MGKLDVGMLDNLNIPGMSEDDIETGEFEDIPAPDLGEEDEPTKKTAKAKTEESEEEEFEIGEVDSLAELQGELGDEEDEEGESSGSDEDGEHTLMVKYLASKGLLDIDDEEELEESEDLIINKFQDKINAGIEAYKESLPDVVKNIIDKYDSGVPIYDYLESEARMQEYKSIDPEELGEDVELQKQLVANYLRTQDYDDDEIKSRLQKYEDNMLLEDEAASALKRLTKMEANYKAQLEEQSVRQRENAKKSYEKAVADYTKNVMEMKEVIPGIPVSDSQKKKVVDAITKPVATDKAGRPINLLKKMELEDPNFATKVAYVAAVLNWDLSPIEKKAKTKAAKSVKNKVNTYNKDTEEDSAINISAVRKALRRAKKQSKIF